MNEFLSIFLLGTFICAGFAQFALFVLHKNEPDKLYFGILCIFLGLVAALSEKNFLSASLPVLAQENLYKVVVLAIFIIMPVYLTFIKSLFPEALPPVVLRVSQTSGPILAFAALFMPIARWQMAAPFFLGTTVIYFLYLFFILAAAIIRKREGAILSLTASLCLSFSFVISLIITGNYLISQLFDEIFVSFGLLLFLISISFVVVLKTTEVMTKVEELLQKDKAVTKVKDNFLSNTLQEIRSPLINILKISESLSEAESGNLNGIQKSNISMILSAARRLQTQTGDLFDYLGIHKKENPTDAEPHNLNAIVQSVCDQYQSLLKGKPVKLKNEIREQIPPVGADDNRVRQILVNLMEAAIKYTPKGVLAISSQNSEKAVEIMITVSGGAIPKNKLDAAFHSLDRSNFLAQPDLDATDLEISIVKSLVESHGGIIWAESGPAQEFKIIFTLPAALNESPETNQNEAGIIIQASLTEAAVSEAAAASAPLTDNSADLEAQNLSLRQANQALEEKVRELSSNLEQTNRKLEKIGEELSRLEKSRRNLLSNISHDLRSPMTSIQGYVDAIIDGLVEDPVKQRDYLLRVRNKITGLYRLTEELFRLTKLEARQVEFIQRLVPVAKLLQNIYERYKLEVSAGEIHYELTVPAEFTSQWPMILIDTDHLDRVFANLILNAVKFTPQGGTIILSCDLSGHDVVFKVTDTGAGIAEKDLPFIFDRFYMGSKARTSTAGGSGLGLTIAKEVVEYHGGSIWAESKPGEGSTLLIKLPVCETAPFPVE
ncbi:MAG: ATP-binding protein [Thermincola sp.]|jgi:signal transduction histidine kinase|nr:ATP-binding protein [Thermincola sp.]MDT3704114.1 ATP-binding protein [Thermincola sp.]